MRFDGSFPAIPFAVAAFAVAAIRRQVAALARRCAVGRPGAEPART